MQTPSAAFLDVALQIIEELDDVVSRFSEFGSFDPSSPAATENVVVRGAGVDSSAGIVSILGVHLLLHLKLYASREHLLGCVSLASANHERTLENPIRALARSAAESSAVCLWLCGDQITPDERLRRVSQLQLKSSYAWLRRYGIDPNDPPDPSSIPEGVSLTLADCNMLLGEVKARGWTCRKGKHNGKPPTISKWVREVPSFTELMGEASSVIPVTPEELRVFYAGASMSVHTDPVTVATGPGLGHGTSRLALALSSTGVAFGFYAYAVKVVADWCSVAYPEEAVRVRFVELDQQTKQVWAKEETLDPPLRSAPELT